MRQIAYNLLKEEAILNVYDPQVAREDVSYLS